MIEDGSGFGIHFVVTSLEYQSVRECMYYGENILTKFPERIIFSLGSNDADNLIENVSVAGLRDNTVYFTDGVKNTFQMKPYITPAQAKSRNCLVEYRICHIHRKTKKLCIWLIPNKHTGGDSLCIVNADANELLQSWNNIKTAITSIETTRSSIMRKNISSLMESGKIRNT